ncbi:unnamed protein product, partial [Discosporangium mesarthrocarpum]
KVPDLSVEYGQQLEFRGEIDQALSMYESALMDTPPSDPSSSSSSSNPPSYIHIDGSSPGPDLSARARRAICKAGIARCTLRLGDLQRGVRLAKEVGYPQLYRDCASILEGMKQPGEAATMYELGGQHDRAAAIHVAGKNFEQAAAVMPRVTLPKLLGQYGRACEITSRL